MSTTPEDPNVRIIAQRMSEGRKAPPDEGILRYMRERSHIIQPAESRSNVAGIDSSDNLLMQIPGQPGAGVAGYSFGLSVCGPDGSERAHQYRSVERRDESVVEDLEITLVYNMPTRDQKRLLGMADYQFRSLTTVAGGKSPYEDQDNPPEFKLRLAAARLREITERRSIRIFLNQGRVSAPLFLKDGRLSAQSCSTRYMDDLGRLAVRRGVRMVGVVKQGTRLWDELYPYHMALSLHHQKSAYWAELSPQIIWDVYAFPDQWTPKTIHLGGIGGLWVMYSPGPTTFYIIEFNVYDMAEYRPLVDTHEPLEDYNRRHSGWNHTYVVRRSPEFDEMQGTQMQARDEDFEELVIPILQHIHHLATLTRVSPSYPVVLADAHNLCKITSERKDRKNAELIAQLTQMGFHPVDFETWDADPHKIFEQ
jgi:hypothetical protein